MEIIFRICRNNLTICTPSPNTTSSFLKTSTHWPDLLTLLSNLSFQPDPAVMSPRLQARLQDLSAALAANLTQHRAASAGPVTARDLASFAEHLDVISGRVGSPGTAWAMEKLAMRTRKVVEDYVKKLEQLRDGILYRITVLEVEVVQLKRQLNQTTAHLKTIQYFFDNQAGAIAEKVRRLVLSLQRSFFLID